jgi:hypothetical protein
MSVVTSSLRVNNGSSQNPAVTVGSVTPQANNVAYNCSLANGTAADQCNLQYINTLALVASTPQALNLQSLTDVYGNSLSFSKIRQIIINMKSTTDGQTLTLGYGTTTANAWTSLVSNPGTITLQAATTNNNAVFVLTAPNTTGWAVGSSNRLLQFDPGSATFNVDVLIWGA